MVLVSFDVVLQVYSMDEPATTLTGTKTLVLSGTNMYVGTCFMAINSWFVYLMHGGA